MITIINISRSIFFKLKQDTEANYAKIGTILNAAPVNVNNLSYHLTVIYKTS